MKLVELSLVTLLVGCGYRYTPTTQNAAAAKPANCMFDLLTTRPSRPFVELGVLEPQGSQGKQRTAAAFRDSVAADVCRVGGDAVLTEVNGLGDYVRGTVIKYRDEAAAPPSPAPGGAVTP